VLGLEARGGEGVYVGLRNRRRCRGRWERGLRALVGRIAALGGSGRGCRRSSSLWMWGFRLRVVGAGLDVGLSKLLFAQEQ